MYISCVFTVRFNKEEKVLQAVITKCLKRYYPQRYYVSPMTCTCTHTHTHTHTHARTHTHNTHIHTYTCTYTHSIRMHTHTHTRTHTHVWIHVYFTSTYNKDIRSIYTHINIVFTGIPDRGHQTSQ